MTDSFRHQTMSLPAQLRWAAAIDVPELATPGCVLVTGMGGSGIAGDFAAVLADREGFRLHVVKGYDLPGWAASERPLVVAVSYSGNTEETLEVTRRALGEGLSVIGISSGGELATLELSHHVAVPGGNQPRASLGFLLGALCRVLRAASLLGSDGLDEAAAVVEKMYREEDIGSLVDQLQGRIVIPWAGSPLTAPVAQRWKTQLNENAKAPAWWSLLPEADHNEIVGWASLQRLTSASVVILPLRDREEHPRVTARFSHTRQLTSRFVRWSEEVWSRGEGPLSRMLSLASVADLVTLELAERYGVDAESVALIEELKQRLKES